MVGKRVWELGAAVLLLLAIAAGAHLYTHYRRVNEALGAAMGRNDAPAVQRAFWQGASPGIRDSHRRTVLVWASVFGKVDLVEGALRRGADVNAQADGGITALMWASVKGHPEIVRRLLLAGADVNLRDDKGRTALSWAADGQVLRKDDAPREVFSLLRQAGARK